MGNRKRIGLIAVLVFLNIVMLCAFFSVRNRARNEGVVTKTVYDNTINKTDATTETKAPQVTDRKENTIQEDTDREAVPTAVPTETPAGRRSSEAMRTTGQKQETCDVYVSNTGGNGGINAVPIVLQNMFPGDSISQDYILTVQYTNEKNVPSVLQWYCEMQEGSDPALVGELEITIEQNGQCLWSGSASAIDGADSSLIQNIYELDNGKNGKFRKNWDVTITVSLPTSAGNEVQNKKAILNFCWQIGIQDAVSENGQHTVPVISPKTGDAFRSLIWILPAFAAFVVALLVVARKRKEGKPDAK